MAAPPDHFAALGQPRRPWLAPDALKETFQRAAAVQHPDVAGEAEGAMGLNAAFATLREPAARLRHLLELEHPEALAARPAIPNALAEDFMRLATLRQAAEAFLDQLAGADSPLGQALLASERFSLHRDLERQLRLLEAAESRALERLHALDADWAPSRAGQIATAVQLQQEFAYLAKWTAQLRETLFRLG